MIEIEFGCERFTVFNDRMKVEVSYYSVDADVLIGSILFRVKIVKLFVQRLVLESSSFLVRY